MNELQLVEREGKLLVESQAIAEELGVNHKSFLDILYRYQDSIEASFGAVAFEMRPRADGKKGGDQPKIALLTEDQAIFVATLSKNTEKVVILKAKLVKAYSIIRATAKQMTSQLTLRETLELNLKMLDEMDKVKNELNQANSQISNLTPLAIFATDLLDIKESSILLREAGPMFNLGRNTFYEILRKIGILKKYSNYPKQIYFNKGYFVKKAKGDLLPDGTKAASDVAIVTTLGLEFLHGLGIFKNKCSENYELQEFETIKKCIENKSKDLMKFTLEDTRIETERIF